MIAICLTTPRRREFIPPAELPVEVQPALADAIAKSAKSPNLYELDKALDAADQQRAIAEHKQKQKQCGDQDWWLIVDLVLVNVVLYFLNRWLLGV